MANDSNQPNKPEVHSIPKVLWLFVAFIPSVVAIPCFGIKTSAPLLLPALVILDLLCSSIAAVGLVRGMKNEAVQSLLGLFLGGFFIIFNVVITVFVGCSGMGRIAP